MAYALVSHVAAAGANTFTTGTINTSGASLIVVSITENGTGSVALSDNKGNTGWTRLPQQYHITGASQLCLAYMKNPVVGSGHTFTATGSSIFCVLSVAAFSGADLTAPADDEEGAGGAGASTGQQTGTVTPTTDNQLIISGAAWATSITVTSVTGMTILDQTDFSGGVNYGGALAYAIQTTAAAVNPAWNWTGGPVASNFAAATFKAAAGGGGGGSLDWVPQIRSVAGRKGTVVPSGFTPGLQIV